MDCFHSLDTERQLPLRLWFLWGGTGSPMKEIGPSGFESSAGLSATLLTFPSPTGMPDFLEKLHTATLKAKNMEIKVKDYISSV